ncbi:hypothetical protein F4808DRAFT_117339 [Astrocystis sublimbata]|nr:hypothetical protein F4808DRAFT_117339 [Astrocystis sublimbata]
MDATHRRDAQLKRLRQMSDEYGLSIQPPPLPKPKPECPPSYRTDNDIAAAEEVLRRQRPQNRSFKEGLSKTFTTKKTAWEYKEIYDALEAHVSGRGSAGVAEVLISKMNSLGGNINLVQKTRTGLLNRRKSSEMFEKSKVLQIAVQNNQLEMVEVLLPSADVSALNTSLPVALHNGSNEIAELLIRYGAAASQTAEGQDAFRQACVVDQKVHLIAMIVASQGRPSASWVSQSMIHATKAGCLNTVIHLSQSIADGNYEGASALKSAVELRRRDITLALLLGSRPPQQPAVNQAFEQLISQQNTNSNEKLAMTELLLCAGAEGAPVAQALVHACATKSLQMVQLLVSYGASLDFQDAVALRNAVSKGDIDLIKTVLSGTARMSPNHASQCVQLLPKDIHFGDRRFLLDAFLRFGAAGVPLDEALIDSAKAGDAETVKLLISPLVQANENAVRQNAETQQHMNTTKRHETASTDYKGALALQIAVEQRSLTIASLILTHKPPTHVILAQVFPSIQGLPRPERLELTKLSLKTRLSGLCVNSALEQAICTEKPIDKQLSKVLLEQGNADVNINGGAIVEYAAKYPDVEILDIILEYGQPNNESIDRALKGLGTLTVSTFKVDRLEKMLSRTESRGAVSSLLIEEVKQQLEATSSPRDFTFLKFLLSKGADVNSFNGEALSCAVAASSMQIVDILFTASPLPMTLAWVMPHALHIHEPMDRLSHAQKILDGGMPHEQVNRALIFTIQAHPDDIPLINALLTHADTSDGMALLEAIRHEKHDIVKLMLGNKSFATDVLNAAFAEAMKSEKKTTRAALSETLLKAGASGEIVSDALLAAASDGDLAFGTILLQNGGSINHKEGQAIVEACESGALSVLEMLLKGNTKVSLNVLQKGFQGATQLSDLKRRAEIFQLLLQMGATGEVVDIQLVSAVRYADEGTDMVKLLLQYGANPDYNNGEAVEKAIRSAFLENLELLLGLAPIDERASSQQKKPSPQTLAYGLDACWDLNVDTRFTVIKWLFKSGQLTPNAINSALYRAVKGSDPEERLIRYLMQNSASPIANDCQALVAAASTLSPPLFEELLEPDVTNANASLVFSKAFVYGDPNLWFSERGLKIATSLLERGARGDTAGAVLVAVLKHSNASSHALTISFVSLLLNHGADVNHNHGEAVQFAVAHGDKELLATLLKEKPNAETLKSAFPKIFDASIAENQAHELLVLFLEYRNANVDLDDVLDRPGSDPVVVRALSLYPRSTKILETLFDIGFYYDQVTTYKGIIDGLDEAESINLLMWALLQPQKKISTNVIHILIERGSKVNFETAVSHVTPLMLAIRTCRQDVVKLLLLAGAEVDQLDVLGNSPLSLASAVGGELAVTMMSNLLAAGAPKNDGSLHNAARELNMQAMRVLVEFGHDPDFPSPLHDGRSALAELCLHASDSVEITASREKAMERAVDFLLQSGTDVTIQSEGKSALLLALESADPTTTTKIVLRAALWKEINKSFNQYNDGEFTYSPTMYVKKVLANSDNATELVRLLRANRCADVYYKNLGPQPDDSVGMPPHIQLEEEQRQARLDRLRLADENHVLTIRRNKELAAVQAQILASQTEQEEARKKRAQNMDIAALQERAHVEEDLFNAALRQQRAKQLRDLEHQENLTKASVTRARAIGDAELAVEGQKQARLLEWERSVGSERVGNERQLSSVRLREREEMDKLDKAADTRFKARLKEQKKLVDSQSTLAANLNSAPPGARRQIGFVSGELD